MPSVNDVIFYSPINLYKDYYLGKYIINNIKCAYEFGQISDIKANTSIPALSPRALGCSALAITASPFLILYNLFTSSKELDEMTEQRKLAVEINQRALINGLS